MKVDTDRPTIRPLLEIEDLSVSYGAIAATHGVSLSVYPGEIVALIGNNGAGKSSTLNAIMGLVKPNGGRVTLDGTDATAKPPERLMNAGLTLSPEGRRIFGGLSVQENLSIGSGPGVSRSERLQRQDEMFELFPILNERKSQMGDTLSGGEQQQLALGRALMSRPKVLMLDEPSLGLAPLITEQIFEIIQKLGEQGMTILLVEQNVDRAMDVADRAYVLSAGRVEMDGTTEELASSGDLEAAYFGTMQGV
ncbi:MAG: ABC transporter ATP-binding protein [Thermoleophilia bacterium]|nr:ABC transporter ATP-binding protein [Thermoleophilia bacterium]